MAFGAEMKDFIGAFKTGYDMIEGPEEKERKRAEEARKQGSYEREGKWGEEDRTYRNQRAAVGDDQWGQQFAAGRSDQKFSQDMRAGEFEWRKGTDERDFEYRGGRDATEDKRWDTTREDQLDERKYNRDRTEFMDSETLRQRGREETRQDRQDAISEDDRKFNRQLQKLAIAKGFQGDITSVEDMKKFLGERGELPAPIVPQDPGTADDAAVDPDNAPEDPDAIGADPVSYRPGAVGDEERAPVQAGFQPYMPKSQPGMGGFRPGTSKDTAYRLVADLSDDFGMPAEVAAGIVGQLAHESGGFQTMQEKKPMIPGSRGGFGYAQWTGPRRKQYERFVKTFDLDPKSYEANYGFLKFELARTAEGNVLKKLRRAQSPRQAGRIFTDGFLRPGIPGYKSRDRWTDRVAGLLGGRRRGAVGAAVGGVIEAPVEEDDEFGPMPQEEAGVPDEEMQVADSGNSGGYKAPTDAYQAGQVAAKEGLNRAIKDLGLDAAAGVDDPEISKAAEMYAKGYGAAPTQMMKQVIDAIDPDGEMTPAERNLKALGTVYQFYQDKGQPEKATGAAAEMMLYYKQTSDRYAALAKIAAQNGDIDGAQKAAIAAYANIPDGNDVSIEKGEDGNLNITFTDMETGEVDHKTVLSPKEFAATVMGMDSSNFEKSLMRAAGIKQARAKAPSPSETMKLNDAAVGAVGEAVGAAEEAGTPIAAPVQAAMEDAATSIAANNNLPINRATRIIQDIIAQPKQAGTPMFRAEQQDDGLWEVQTVGGERVLIDNGAYQQLARIAEQSQTAAVSAEEQAAAAAKRSENISKAGSSLVRSFSEVINGTGGPAPSRADRPKPVANPPEEELNFWNTPGTRPPRRRGGAIPD